jgi:hypothetical protein
MLDLLASDPEDTPLLCFGRGYPGYLFMIVATEEEIREMNPIELLSQSELSVMQFAAYMGVTERTIQYWINGSRNPSPQARRLAAELAEKWGVMRVNPLCVHHQSSLSG